MSTATVPTQQKQRAIDEIGVFLPTSARKTLGRAIEILESADVQVDAFLRKMMEIGESVLQSGLDWTVEGSEALVARMYEAGIMERLGDLNSFARDGAEIGIQLTLNTLKALEPADVARIVGVAVVALMAPQLILSNGPEFLEIVVDLLQKLWNLP